MSMSPALEHLQEWFRLKNGWKPNECGVQHDALPALDAGYFYVAFDDAGVEPGNELTDSIKEILTITVGIWLRTEHLSGRDLRGHLKLPEDQHLLQTYTLHDLERMVILPKNNGLHCNYRFLESINLRYDLPHAERGAAYNRPLFYKGRGRVDSHGVDYNDTVQTWYGYRLRFRGLDREQKLRGVDDPQG